MFSHNLANINGQSSAHVFHSLFNPAGSGVLVVLHRMDFTPYAASSALVATSTQVLRITSHSGGVLTYDPTAPSNEICKRDTGSGDSIVEIRTDGPSITPDSIIRRVPPPVQSTTAGPFAASQIIQDFRPEYGEFILRPGEGVAYRQTGSGSAAHRVPYAIEWMERLMTEYD